MATTAYFSTFEQLSSETCIVDSTAPTFAGISAAVPSTSGSIEAQWLVATDVSNPIEYLIYISIGSVNAATLFQTSNLVSIAPSTATSKKIFTLADQTTYLVNGQQYTMGVRAKDSVGNINTNVALLTPTATASGNLPAVYQTLATNIAATEILLAADEAAIAATELLLAADEAALAATVASIGAISSSLGASAGTQMSFENNETVMTIETDGVP